MQDQAIATESHGAGVYHEDVGMGETRQVEEAKEHSDAGRGAEDVSTTRGLIFPFERSEITQGGMQFAALIVAVIFGVWAIKSYNAAQKANALAENGLRQSLLANQMSLVSLCAIGIFNQLNTPAIFAVIMLNHRSRIKQITTQELAPMYWKRLMCRRC
jgi:hypothetical protein